MEELLAIHWGTFNYLDIRQINRSRTAFLFLDVVLTHDGCSMLCSGLIHISISLFLRYKFGGRFSTSPSYSPKIHLVSRGPSTDLPPCNTYFHSPVTWSQERLYVIHWWTLNCLDASQMFRPKTMCSYLQCTLINDRSPILRFQTKRKWTLHPILFFPTAAWPPHHPHIHRLQKLQLLIPEEDSPPCKIIKKLRFDRNFLIPHPRGRFTAWYPWYGHFFWIPKHAGWFATSVPYERLGQQWKFW